MRDKKDWRSPLFKGRLVREDLLDRLHTAMSHLKDAEYNELIHRVSF